MFSPNAQRIAIIDLGSNTARLIVMSAIPGYAYHLDDEIREVVRLREGLNEQGLSAPAVARALVTLRLFKRFCDSSRVDVIIPTATSAVREARNGAAFMTQVAQEIGLNLRLLSGEEEAYYATLGALNELPLANGYVLDIGGGSAQIAQVQDNRFYRAVSHPLGALALTEQFVRTDPIASQELAAVSQFIDDHLDATPWLNKKKINPQRRLVALGGAVRNLAKMDAVRQSYPLNTLHGYRLTAVALQENIRLLATLPLAERRRLPGLNSDRADIILPGALVLQAVMARLQVEELTVSINGLREGLFFEHFWRHLAYPVMANVRRFSVLNLARIYNYDKRHAAHVRFLAGRLFQQLRPLHNYGPAEQELLDAAALLHDLGAVISYQDHHKHSQTLIINSGLPGFTPRETLLIALLTRYHRKGRPVLEGCGGLLCTPEDEEMLLRLAAILRLAEFLERGRNATVDDVTAVWDDHTLRLTLIADEYPAVELWEARRYAVDLLESAFSRVVTLESTAPPDPWFVPVAP